MKVVHLFLVSLTCSIISVQAQGSVADNLALFWNLYDSVVRGSRILHDVTEGVGAVSKAIAAIDNFLDISNEEELAKNIKEGESAPAPATDAVKDTSTVSTGSQIDQTCDANTGICRPLTPEVSAGAESLTMPKFNGCGALGFHIKDSELPVDRMTDCCGTHDKCYKASCKANKRDCDSKLRSCLFQVCDGKTLDRSLLKSCRAAAKLLFSGTMALSFQQYNEAQNPLKCPGKKNRGRRRD